MPCSPCSDHTKVRSNLILRYTIASTERTHGRPSRKRFAKLLGNVSKGIVSLLQRDFS